MALVGKIEIDSVLLLSDGDVLFLASDEELLLSSFTGIFHSFVARARKFKFNITESNKRRLLDPAKRITEASHTRLTESGDIRIVALTSELVIMFVIKARKTLFNITE